jgi:hypothetical protein
LASFIESHHCYEPNQPTQSIVAAGAAVIPQQVPANAFEANATNPLGMDPMLLATAFYASLAMESESAYDGETSEHTLQ